MSDFTALYADWNQSCDDTVTILTLSGNEYYADGLPTGTYYVASMGRTSRWGAKAFTANINMGGIGSEPLVEGVITADGATSAEYVQRRVTGRCNCDSHVYGY